MTVRWKMAFARRKVRRILALFRIVLCVCVFGAPTEARFAGVRKFEGDATGKERERVEENWLVQRLDHFNGADQRVWKQRYFVNERFYRAGGPVFLMIGGEGPANPAWMQYGTWLTYAEKLGALCLLLEHRFYGKSHPTEDLRVENLQFLSSRQALADLAHFRTITAALRGLTNSKWIAFGGSYPGSLAAWLRLKYPHLFHASVATSAPVNATVNFPEYLEVVQRSLAAENWECPLMVKNASETLISRLKDQKTYNNITKDFRLCSKLEVQSDMDTAYLLETLAGNFMDVVQYNEDNRAFEGVVGTNITIKVLCDVMLDSSLGEPYSRYAAVARLIQDTFSQPCTDVQYSHYLRDMRNTSWSGPVANGGRQWLYQTCAEFGFYQSTDSPHQPFDGFPLLYHLQQCKEIYNLSNSVDDAVLQTNEEYGGLDIKSTRIVFINGSVDPWHALGVNSNITDELPAIFIKGTAHCANMYPACAADLPQLISARNEILILLEQWLQE